MSRGSGSTARIWKCRFLLEWGPRSNPSPWAACRICTLGWRGMAWGNKSSWLNRIVVGGTTFTGSLSISFATQSPFWWPVMRHWACLTLKMKFLSRVRLFVTPMGYVACQVPPSMGFFQAGILKWVAISFSRGIFPTQGSNPGLLHSWQTSVPCKLVSAKLGGGWFTFSWSCWWGWPPPRREAHLFQIFKKGF